MGPVVEQPEGVLGPYQHIGGHGGHWGWGFSLDVNAFVSFDYNFGSDSPWGLAGGDLSDGEWHHLAATIDEAEAVLYVDGRRRHMLRAPLGALMAGSTQLPALGASVLEGGVTGLSTVTIDEFMVWSEALPPEEIQALRFPQGAAPDGDSGSPSGEPVVDLCRGTDGLLQGSYVIDSEDDIASLVSCTRVTGDLRIENTDLTARAPGPLRARGSPGLRRDRQPGFRRSTCRCSRPSKAFTSRTTWFSRA